MFFSVGDRIEILKRGLNGNAVDIGDVLTIIDLDGDNIYTDFPSGRDFYTFPITEFGTGFKLHTANPIYTRRHTFIPSGSQVFSGAACGGGPATTAYVPSGTYNPTQIIQNYEFLKEGTLLECLSDNPFYKVKKGDRLKIAFAEADDRGRLLTECGKELHKIQYGTLFILAEEVRPHHNWTDVCDDLWTKYGLD